MESGRGERCGACVLTMNPDLSCLSAAMNNFFGSKPLLTPCLVKKILRHMHGVLNLDENKN